MRRKPGRSGRIVRQEVRGCGECRACCVVLCFEARAGESAFSKPANTPCPELVEIGCGIYDSRPPVCRRFECAWLSATNLPAELRPDRCGVLFCTNDSVLGEGHAVYAYEMRPGAVDEPLPQWLIEQVAQEITVYIVRAGAPVEVLTPDTHLQQRLQDSVE